MNARTDNKLLTTAQAAARLGLHPQTLASWRLQGRGPRWVKLGERPKSPVRYRAGDLDEYLRQQSQGGAIAENA